MRDIHNIDEYILGNEDTIDTTECKMNNIYLIELSDVRKVITKRKRNSHKGTYGKVGMLSGSKGMAGAAVLNLNAALRSGAGLVKAFIPNSIYNVVESMSIEAMTHPFNEEKLYFEEIYKEMIDFSDVIASGSGCANLFNYRKILNCLTEKAECPLVIDAEGINDLNLNILKNHKQDIVLTPHYGEMARLINKDVKDLRENIINTVRTFSQEYNVYLVLKGARTVISCPNKNVFINTTGNPGMATAGSGDVLTGIIASFIGQKMGVANAVMAAVFIHGMAGDIGAAKVGEYSLVASDLIKFLPEAFKKISI
ncbi:MAG: NAD(P)H-hydrate dehydratase [Sedimentibacter sp.]